MTNYPILNNDKYIKRLETKVASQQQTIKLYREKNAIDRLVADVEKWSHDKGLDKSDSKSQALKFYEEAGEVAAALVRKDPFALKDGIGDTIVTLIILAQQQGTSIEECLEMAYEEIKDRRGKLIGGSFVKESDLQKKKAGVKKG